MIWNDHSNLEGLHAFLGASKYSWLNYDEMALRGAYIRSQAAKRGTELHNLARSLIELGQRLPKSKKTLNAYVNDAIGYRMKPEQILYYSPFCFGTADAISFKHGLLRIHDLKTGMLPAHIEQLEVYAALFFLEYKLSPEKVTTKLRIYQNDEILCHEPEPEDILAIMNKIVEFDKILGEIQREEA